MANDAYSLISLPRSGQHLSERLIQKIYEYFSKDFSYCEFYNCCKSVPCKNGSIFMKNHDFKLDLVLPRHYKKIILYRTSMIEQLESYYRLLQIEKRDLLKSKFNIHINVDFDYINNKKSYFRLLSFIMEKEKYYNGFISKWVNARQNNDNTLLLPYSEIINNPFEYVKKIITFLDIPHTQEDINTILNNFEKIEYKNSLDPFVKKHIENDLSRTAKERQVLRHDIRHDIRSKHTFIMKKVGFIKKHPLGVMRFL